MEGRTNIEIEGKNSSPPCA